MQRYCQVWNLSMTLFIQNDISLVNIKMYDKFSAYLKNPWQCVIYRICKFTIWS